MRRVWILLMMLGLVASGVRAQPSYYLVPDVPTDLNGTPRLPWEVIRNDLGVYGVATALPAIAQIDALHRMGSGDWLISLGAATTLGGLDWDRRDVFVFTTGGAFAPFPSYGGAVAQIPPGSNVDAVFLEPVSGDVIVSFDTPTTIGGVTYEPADLVRYAGAFVPAPFFDASAAGIPVRANLTGADVRPGGAGAPLTVLSLDIPTTVGAPTFLPGEILSWDGATLAVFDPQLGWPGDRSSRVNAFSFLADPGDCVPPGLMVTLFSPTQVNLAWNQSNCAGGEDWGVYEGLLGTWYSHTPVTCSTGGALNFVMTFAAAGTYYLVVTNNPNDEGSEGIRRLSPPPPGGTPVDRSGPPQCRPTRLLGCSP